MSQEPNLPNELEQAKRKHHQIMSGTFTLTRHDTYGKTIPMSRWSALKAFVMGTVIIKWEVPATRKDKRLRLTGKRLW